ncbi:MAG: MopE-related protein, partial [Myxococcota bacterium]|nr:MopE-related protein [Myxococcota bacterium]
DSEATTNPAASETVGDGVDSNCNGRENCYRDADDDGYRPNASAQVVSTDADCDDSGEALATDPIDDCDDSNAARNPGATEVCDASDLDEDCTGLADDDDPGVDTSTHSSWYLDSDGDGYGDESGSPMAACDEPSGATYVLDATDCDDTTPSISPAEDEVCSDGIDNNCDGSADPCEITGDITLNGGEDGRWHGAASGDAAATHLALLGDLDGDGNNDVAVGAPGVDSSTLSDVGAVYLLAGPTTVLESLSTKTSVRGSEANQAVGTMARSGDVDGDGQADLLLGVPADGSTDDGALYVVYGPVTSSQDLSSYDARLSGELTGDGLGSSIAVLGDYAGVGTDALLLGAADSSSAATGAGIAYIALGPLTADVGVATAASVTAEGEAAGDEAGFSVALGGDLTGDGTRDFVIGAPGQDGGGVDAGAAYIFTGSVAGSVSVADADIKANGAAAGDTAGWAVVGGGDINGDGLDDLLIGAPLDDSAGTLAGAVYVLQGDATLSATVDLGSDALRVSGQAAGDLAGYDISAVGDVNVDGFGDFVVGGPDHATGGAGAGAAWLVTGPVSGSVSLGSAEARILGVAAGDETGTSVIGVEDWDGDGVEDFLVGSPGDDSAGPGAGALGVLFGGGL